MIDYKEENFLRELTALMRMLNERTPNYKIILQGNFCGYIQDGYSGRTLGRTFGNPEEMIQNMARVVNQIDNDKGFIKNILERIGK